MSYLTRNAVILAALETAYGVDASPDGAHALAVSNLSITPLQAEFAGRDLIRPYYGSSEQLPTAVSVQMEFEIELQSSGTAGTAPAWGPVLRGCGFAETVSAGSKVDYTPISKGFESLSFAYLLGGESGSRVVHKMTGARGTVSFSLKAKAIPTMKFRFQGLYSAVRDSAAALNVDYSAFLTPLPSNAVNTPTWALHGITSPLSEFTADMANTLVYRPLIGSESVKLTDRKAAGTAVFEATSVATYDWWTAARTAKLGTLHLVHGTDAGQIVEFASTRVQVSDPSYKDESGIAMLSTKLAFVPSSAGNDELIITAR